MGTPKEVKYDTLLDADLSTQADKLPGLAAPRANPLREDTHMRRLLLLIMLGGLVPLSRAQDIPQLDYNQLTTIAIAGGQPYSATFMGEAGTLVYATLTGIDGLLEAQLRVFDMNGGLVATARYFGDRAWVEPFTLPLTGRYTLAFQREAWSEYTGGAALVVDTITPQALASGVMSAGTVAQYGLAAHTFAMTAGDLFAYRLDCDGECTLVLMFPPPAEGPADWLAESYFSQSFWLPLARAAQTGTYTLYINAQTPDTPYTLEVSRIEPLPLTVNTPAEGNLPSQTAVAYSFTSAAGKVWQFNAAVVPGTALLEIYRFDNRQPWETVIAADGGSGPNGNPRIAQFIAPEDGLYYVVLRWSSNNETPATDYTLNVSPETLQLLVDGTQFDGTITPDAGQAIYLYNGTAGEQVRLTVERTTDTGALQLRVLSDQDEVIAYTERGSVRAQFELVLPLEGRYRVIISDAAYEPTTLGYTILLEK